MKYFTETVYLNMSTVLQYSQHMPKGRNTLLCLVLAACLVGCATPSRFHATHVPPGSLIVTQVMAFATQQEILSLPTVVETFELSGIERSQIQDGMLADGRIFCCGGPNELDYSIWFYVPTGTNTAVGDVVEVKMGPRVMKGESMQAGPNTMLRVVSPLDQVGKECKWVPENPALRGRVLYCDWMKEDGWVQQSGLFNVWIKSTGNK